MHLDIKNEKIWIRCNTTEVDIGEELIKLGVNKQDIVMVSILSICDSLQNMLLDKLLK